MPVYLIAFIAPNGNRVSRPIVASTAGEAISIMEVEHGIGDAQAEGFKIEASPLPDPNREMEARLLKMEARNRERELWERCR
jgi:hypothetical protein